MADEEQPPKFAAGGYIKGSDLPGGDTPPSYLPMLREERSASTASFDLPGGESTSAELRRVEQARDEAKQQCLYLNRERLDAIEERDEALRQRDKFVAAADKLNDSWLALKAELATAIRERDEAVRRAADLEQVREELAQIQLRAESDAELIRSLVGEKQELIDEKLALKAELASAHAELDALRAARDNLDRELGEARVAIRALVGAPYQPPTEGAPPE